MSNYVVIARFDEETDKKLFSLRDRFEAAGFRVQEWPPHVTIAAYENIGAEPLCDWTYEFSENHKPFELSFNSLSIFPPSGEQGNSVVLFLSPAHSKTLVDFYYEFHSKHEEYCTGIGWYNSIVHDNPIMHCTLGEIEKNRIQEAMDIAIENNAFTKAQITALELYTYPMKLIKRFELKGRMI